MWSCPKTWLCLICILDKCLKIKSSNHSQRTSLSNLFVLWYTAPRWTFLYYLYYNNNLEVLSGPDNRNLPVLNWCVVIITHHYIVELKGFVFLINNHSDILGPKYPQMRLILELCNSYYHWGRLRVFYHLSPQRSLDPQLSISLIVYVPNLILRNSLLFIWCRMQ